MEEVNLGEQLEKVTREAERRRILDIVVNAATKEEAEEAIRNLLKNG
ncbi:MAG: protein phosphatase [Oscillospiraceae bacterium]|jgi:hypothetical protein|nr:protein phosphatase [Oscillospiraceae bacterium]